MFAFFVEVDYTDRSRRSDGRFCTTTRTVTVLAEDEDEAALVALQMVAAMRDDAIDGMVIASRVIDAV